MLRFLLIMLVVSAAMVGAAIWVVAHPGPFSTTAVTVIFTAGIAMLASAAFRLMWSPALAAYPPQEPAPDAVRRRFQSFGLDFVNMGLSVHVAVDESYLHLEPLRLWRMLGARSASIPWSAMTLVKKRVVRFDGHRLDGPAWCLELAAPAPEAPAPREDGVS